MGLLGKLLTLPVKGPMDASVWVAEKIHEAAEKEWNDPVALKAQLSDAERRLVAGEISEDEYDEIEEALLERLHMAKG
ncbi:hypothetical protein RGUI_4064 [Rhodovulum sp. P5]|uniref:gas vesicle protein GvpG n=1 Tax=Rhodovulum sp. P5 TaxID=1564506 RepID=UPI0009C3D0E9|nr:gas vesicle protein GvpG [Rhodovulum sp. P5]ARE42205.1 hypothetical protein RGUI_4064 [Rhodovulum sp. P5]